MPNRSKGRVHTKSDPTGPPGCEMGRGLISLSCKKKQKKKNKLQKPEGSMYHEARRG